MIRVIAIEIYKNRYVRANLIDAYAIDRDRGIRIYRDLSQYIQIDLVYIYTFMYAKVIKKKHIYAYIRIRIFWTFIYYIIGIYINEYTVSNDLSTRACVRFALWRRCHA